MKVVYCDVCGKADNDTLEAEVMDGWDCPDGSIQHKKIDICIPCLKKLDLSLDMDIKDIRDGRWYKKKS